MKKLLAALLIIVLLIAPSLAENDHPVWTGAPYVEYNGGVPDFGGVYLGGDEFVQYSPRDELGRVGPAVAYLGPKRFSADRDPIQNQTPTGFINAHYDFISGGNLYHRCHLIAHCMTSSGEYAENLFTGTAYLNLGIMSKVEGMITEYISRTQNHVLYKVTPDFIGDELVPRAVIIEAASIEDAEIRVSWYCFNVQPGVMINYATGSSSLAAYAAQEIPFSETAAETDPKIPETEDDGLLLIADAVLDTAVTRSAPEPLRKYVLNNGTHRFHYPDCKSVKDIKPDNYQEYIGTSEEIKAMGYKSCGNCHP